MHGCSKWHDFLIQLELWCVQSMGKPSSFILNAKEHEGTRHSICQK